MVPGTVRDQITLFDPSISDEQVQYAAHLTGLHDVICGFPDGYDTLCRTDLFSQGQWQLLSIARAVAANPRILLLDEITANLDADTEKAVLSALNRAGNGRTVLLSATDYMNPLMQKVKKEAARLQSDGKHPFGTYLLLKFFRL